MEEGTTIRAQLFRLSNLTGNMMAEYHHETYASANLAVFRRVQQEKHRLQPMQ
jgi:hypothetical protein